MSVVRQVSGRAPEHPAIDAPLPLDYADALVGKAAPSWTVASWDGGSPTSLEALRGRVVVVRFYMDLCPFCRATLPALSQMRAELGDVPVTFVGLFHAKPRGAQRDWPAAVATARQWGADFLLGHDKGWKTLDTWYGAFVHRSPTSVTFVIDRHGRFAFIHPGPVYHPSRDPKHARCQSDYEAVRAAIVRALST